MKIRRVGAGLSHVDGRTKLMVGFCNFATAHKIAEVRTKIHLFRKRDDYAAGLFAPSKRPRYDRCSSRIPRRRQDKPAYLL
jgi:hypothetical protein